MIPAGEVHLLAHVVAAICRHMIVTFVAAGHCLGVWSQHAHRYGAPQRAHCSDRISAAVRFFEPLVELIAKRDAVFGQPREIAAVVTCPDCAWMVLVATFVWCACLGQRHVSRFYAMTDQRRCHHLCCFYAHLGDMLVTEAAR